jgi:hypothetical protein
MKIQNRRVTLLSAKLNLQIDQPKGKHPVNKIEQRLYHYAPDKCFVLNTECFEERETAEGYLHHTTSFTIGGPAKCSYHKIACDRYSDKKLLETAARLGDLRKESLNNELWNALKVYPHQIAPVESIMPDTAITEIVIHPLSQGVYIPGETTFIEESYIRQIENPRDCKYSLVDLYHYLNCDTIEVVELDNGNILIIDEEGKCKGLPKNREATALTSRAFQQNDYIVGPAIYCPSRFLK